MFSSMYAILHRRLASAKQPSTENRANGAHVLVDVQRIGLLREVVRSHDAASFGFLVLFIPDLALSARTPPRRDTTATHMSSSSSFFTPCLRPDSTFSPSPSSSSPSPSLSSPSLVLFFFRFFTSPLFSFATSMPCLSFRSFRSSMSSATLYHSFQTRVSLLEEERGCNASAEHTGGCPRSHCVRHRHRLQPPLAATRLRVRAHGRSAAVLRVS